MAVKVGDLRFHDWFVCARNGGWCDIFVFKMSPHDGLPPGDYARIVRKLVRALVKIRSSAGIWIQVDSMDSWYLLAVKYAFLNFPIPIAVTQPKEMLHAKDFSFGPYPTWQIPSPPQITAPYVPESFLSNYEWACLRALARSDCAYPEEIASLAGVEVPEAIQTMAQLESYDFVEIKPGKWKPYWKVRRIGLRLVLRSWWMPPGKTIQLWRERGYPACKERDASAYRSRRSSSGRHRRTTRLFPAWLRRAWPRAEVIAGWPEVPCYGVRPDALCWGKLDGFETLFWLEVESGNRSRWRLLAKILFRFERARLYARGHEQRLVFIVLAPYWVRKAVVSGFTNLPHDVAVVLEDWKAFGSLPTPEWSRVHWSDDRYLRSLLRAKKIKFVDGYYHKVE